MREVLRIIVKYIIILVNKILYRVKVVGRENVPEEGAFILCGNHRSYLDPPLIVTNCKRKVRFIAKHELKKNIITRLAVYIFNGIYVNREAKDVGAMKEVLKTLKGGEGIGIFPEGTRNGMAKGVQAKNGVAYFALNSDAVIIPVGIKGELKPFHKVTITYGKPIDISEYKKDRKNKENLEKVTNIIMEEIVGLI